ncbi:hypothetical protein F6X56_15075 [Rhodococcus erythropolis]|uniref:hypothetical protein n=1 Tax=Rhodococcus erythropolis TaxID=1833 RepID=UPI00124863D7|nr:hypothetical protein [Rhodococcus erythropolis]QEX10944.1 hypothetical protein F6X56_15075 [Rhodococcus erythropolis]
MSKDNTQAELRNLLGELQNRTVSAFTSRRYDEQNILRDEYQEAISACISKQIEAVLDRLANTLTGSNDFRVEPSAKLYLSVGQIITIRSIIEAERKKLKETK